jgi:hypothetical protein
MATLFNTKIKDTYQSLLKLEDNTILTTTTKNITDGLGNASPLYMSTTQVRIGSTSGSAMYWDNVNNRLGIGTNAPTTALHIVGQTTFSDNALFSADFKYIGRDLNSSSIRFSSVSSEVRANISTGGQFQIYNSGTGSGRLTVTSGGQTTISGGGSTSATTSLLVQNSLGTTALSINDATNVLIGTTTDAGYKLDVVGTARVQSTFIAGQNTGNSYNHLFDAGLGGITFRRNDSYVTSNFVTITQPNFGTSANGSMLYITTPGSTKASGFAHLKLVGPYDGGGSTYLQVGNASTITSSHVSLAKFHTGNLQYIGPTYGGSSTFMGLDIRVEGQTADYSVSTATKFVGIYIQSSFNNAFSTFQLPIDSWKTFVDNSTLSNIVTPFTSIDIAPTFNNASNAVTSYGININPTLNSYTGFIALKSAVGNVQLNTTSGNTLIGTTTDAGEKLQVNGTARVGSTLQLDNGAITWGNFSGAPTSRLRITRRTGWGSPTGIEIGALNSNTSAFASSPIVLGDLNTLADVGCVIVGTSNNIQKDAITVIGTGNSVPLVTGVTTSKQIILGDANTANGYTNGQVPGIIVGYGNTQNSFAFSQMYGTLLKPYADGQLLFGANAGPVNPSIREVFIGYGYRNEQTSGNQDNGNGNNLLISPSNASNATDKNGGNLTLTGSRGTGAGTPGNLIFATSTATTTGTTLQTLSERMRINGGGNVLINTTTDSGYKLNVNGTTFVNELITTGGIVKHNPYTPGIRALEIYSGTGHLGNTGVWASMYSTGVYGNGWDPFYGTQGIGVVGDPNNNSNGGSVVNIGVYGGAALSNATGVYGTSGLFGKAANLRNASAALEVNSTTHGFLPPRMTAAQRSALNTITGFGVITGGSGYVDGTYYTVSITGGSGQNAYARIVISGGSVTSVTLETNLGGLTGGFGYTNGASVSASNTQLGGTGAGFSVIINASTPVGMMVYQTDATEGLYIYKSTGWTFIA